eukprot:Skav201027  [mRNA]  locus=scaffold3386:59794:66617:+ [translate_table: standard]
MEGELAQSEQALKRCDRRLTESQKWLKRAPQLPDAKTRLEEEELYEVERQPERFRSVAVDGLLEELEQDSAVLYQEREKELAEQLREALEVQATARFTVRRPAKHFCEARSDSTAEDTLEESKMQKAELEARTADERSITARWPRTLRGAARVRFSVPTPRSALWGVSGSASETAGLNRVHACTCYPASFRRFVAERMKKLKAHVDNAMIDKKKAMIALFFVGYAIGLAAVCGGLLGLSQCRASKACGVAAQELRTQLVCRCGRAQEAATRAEQKHSKTDDVEKNWKRKKAEEQQQA